MFRSSSKKSRNKLQKTHKKNKKILQLFVSFTIHRMCTPLFKFKMQETGLRAKAYSLLEGGELNLALTKKEKADVISNITSR